MAVQQKMQKTKLHNRRLSACRTRLHSASWMRKSFQFNGLKMPSPSVPTKNEADFSIRSHFLTMRFQVAGQPSGVVRGSKNDVKAVRFPIRIRNCEMDSHAFGGTVPGASPVPFRSF
ncbi:hypothetical protein [Rhizobium binxianense]